MGERKRRLSSAWGLKQAAGASDDEVELEPNDDDMEKKTRVTIDEVAASSPLRSKNPNKLAELSSSPKRDPLTAKKRKSVGWGVINNKENQLPASSTPSLSAAHLSNDQLADLYSSCIKLNTENKINQKNSWQLNLIDYMEDVLEHQEVSGDNPNFQAASCTLDASIKIYSCRVDSVHTDTYKVLGGLTRTGDRGEGEQEEGEEGEDGTKNADNDGTKPEEVEKKKKPKKLPVGGVHTLEPNIEALNAKKIDLEFLIDPLFRKTSAAFDEGGAKGLLLNHLSVHHVHHGCELVFDSVDAIDVSASSGAADHSCDISDLQDLLASGGDLRDIADLEICPTFVNFEFEQGKAPKVEKVELNKDSEAMITEDNAWSEGEADDFAGGFDGGAIDFGAGGESDGEDAEGPVKFAFNKKDNMEQVVPGGVDPEMVANDAWADFQHINPKLAKKWAGPEHWRFTSKPTTKGDGKGEGETKKRVKGEKKTKEFFIDFLAPPPPESAFAPPGRTLTTLSAAVLKKASEASTTLPVDVHYDLKMLTQLFSKPKWIIPPVSRRFRKPNRTDAEDGAEGGVGGERGENEPWYEYGNANDASFVNDDNADDDDDHFGGDGFDGPMDQDTDATKREDEEGGNAAAVDFGNGLVAEPAKVAKISINYAKVAKKVDVKALKSTIWTDLCDSPAPSTAKDKDKGNAKKDTFEGERTFESLLASVEKRAGNEVGEVSVALCFICMLHLCNEKGLALAQEGIEDLHISASKT